MNQKLVSIIITTKNEESNIKNCLESIRKQTYPKDKIEIIVVDNNSSDRTTKIAHRYTKLIFIKGSERSAQRNFGVLNSRGEWILYLDADMILSPGLLEDCVQKVKYSNVIALYIPEVIMGDKFWNKVRRFERSFYDGTVIDAVRFVNKKYFLKSGGFDESISGPEDWDFDKKIRNLGNVDISTNPLYHNEINFNLKKYIQKKGYYIVSFDKYVNKWPKQDPDIKKQLGFYYRFFGVFIEKGKWKRIAKSPILTAGMYSLRFLVGIKFITK